MKLVLKFFQTVGDAAGLAVLLGGLMLATNNVAARRATAGVRRRTAASEPARAIATHSARAAA